MAAETTVPPPTTAVSPAPRAKGPRIQFAAPSHDFGPLERGATVAHTFVFSNTGDAMLEVTGVQPGCGCTAAGSWDRQVAPGKTGRIPLQFATATLSGPTVRTISVTSNDPVHPQIVLQISAAISTAIEIAPPTVIFQFTSASTGRESRTVRILNHHAEPLFLEAPQSANGAFRAELRTIRPGQEFELSISTTPPLGTATLSGVISLKTSLPAMPLIQVQAHATTRPDLVCTPARIILPRVSLSAAVTLSVTIMGMATEPLSLIEPKLNLSGADVQVRELRAGRVFSISVSFPAGFVLPPTENVEVTVKSNYPHHPIIHIPVTHDDRQVQ